MADRRCPSCGLNNFDWLDRCGRCGAALPPLATKGESSASNPPKKNLQAQSTEAQRKKWDILLSPRSIGIQMVLFVIGVFYSLILFARLQERLFPSSSWSDTVCAMAVCDLVLFISVVGILKGIVESKREMHWILMLILFLALAYSVVAGIILGICLKGIQGFNRG